MKKHLLFTALVTCVFGISCHKEIGEDNPTQSEATITSMNDPSQKFNVYKGEQVPVGNGYARTWIKMNHLDEPVEIGIQFTPEALTGLPDHVEPGQPHPHYDIPLHHKAKEVTAFDHVVINWNPQGHPPAGLFDVPHFDAHFYFMTVAERLSIFPGDPKALILPPLNERPAGYIASTDAIPAMGNHWIAPPVIPPFTKVLIWGSYNGKMTFIEPMVTVAYMQSGATTHQQFGQPVVFPKPGNYPKQYNVYKDDKGNHQITLSDFIAR
ncbi:MAG TPA: DUF5602 domain-containing protein [Chitinophagaceae bacterium]